MDIKRDWDRFEATLAVLVDVFQREQMSEAAILAYWKALEARSIEAVEQAATTATLTSRRFPAPAELVELAEAAEPPAAWRPPGLPELGQEDEAQRRQDIEAMRRVLREVKAEQERTSSPSRRFRDTVDGFKRAGQG